VNYRLSAAVCAQGSAAREGHYYATVRAESNDWYLHDDACVKAIGSVDDVQAVRDTVYFCVFEQL
jgi:ubiquitin C-terminal hydrolase